MDTLTAYKTHLGEVSKLESAVALLQWDGRTHIPRCGHEGRAEVLGKLSKMAFELAVDDRLGGYLEELEARDDLSSIEQASVRVVGRDYRRNKAIPPELFGRFTVARAKSETAWEQARAASDFRAFAPHLKEMVDYARQFAELLGYEESRYDALLQNYEPGMTRAKLQDIIDPLRDRLVPYLQRLMSSGTPPDAAFLNGRFEVDAQRRLATDALHAIGYDFDAGRMDDTTHPFTIGIGPGDVRVTNRYHEDMLYSGLFSALHEGGHALYEQGIPEKLRPLGLADGASFGIHESQSRTWENLVGRGLPFWRHFRPHLVDAFPALADHTADELCAATNRVRPSLVRVEADEVTYNLHIMLRFDLEVALLDGTLRVDDLPSAWREGMDRYLGIVPETDADGVLQDVHWSAGMIGYFPSYMLGNLYAAQLYATAQREIPDLEERIERGDTGALLEWSREKIHRHGRVYDPEELIERVTGKPPSSEAFLRYIEEKYGAIYGI